MDELNDKGEHIFLSKLAIFIYFSQQKQMK